MTGLIVDNWPVLAVAYGLAWLYCAGRMTRRVLRFCARQPRGHCGWCTSSENPDVVGHALSMMLVSLAWPLIFLVAVVIWVSRQEPPHRKARS